MQAYADEIERLECAQGCGADGDDKSEVVEQVSDGLRGDGDDLGVHGVLVGVVGLDGLESAGSDMEGQFGGADALCTEGVEHLVGEVESGGGCGDGAFDARIDGLVGGFVGLLGVAVEVGRYGQFAELVEYLGEGERAVVPGEAYGVRVADGVETLGAEGSDLQGALFPLLEVTNHTAPCATVGSAEREGIVARLERLKAEDLDACSGGFMEDESRLDDACIVIDEQCFGEEVASYVIEAVFGRLPAVVIPDEQFAMVALRQRVLGYAEVGEWVVIVVDVYHSIGSLTPNQSHKY